ncbi:hypothetical protein [Patulibacter sp.]|uniref:hypothetical protein n=1 Tax=Patulibacter sp. TaxID=1912859 RepID=UPI00271BE43C|nr:hypothetical protein [Patulibacter sp.]MDO9408952.1 hypothetical protein [Patulibacter sp.]
MSTDRPPGASDRGTGWAHGGGPEPTTPSPGGPARRRIAIVAGGVVAVLVVVLVVLLVGGGDGDDRRRLQATGSTQGVPDASGVGRLGSRAALVQLRRRMRPEDTVSDISLTSFHAVASMISPSGGGRTLAITDMPDGDVDVDGDGTTGGSTGLDGDVPGAELDVDAPARLLAAVLRAVGPETRPRILEISARSTDDAGDRSGGLEWKIDVGSVSDEGTWIGDEHGRHVLRPSDGMPAPPEGSRGPALPPDGVNASSLVRPTALRAGLDAVGERPGATGGVTFVRVEPKELYVSFVQPLGSPDAEGLERIRTRTFTVDAAGGIEVDEVLRRARRSEDGVGVPIAAIDPDAPLRALRTIGRREGRDAAAEVRAVEFRAPGTFSGASTGWELELRDGKRLSTWTAKPDGRGVRSGTDG